MLLILTLAGTGYACSNTNYGDFPTDDGTGDGCGTEWTGLMDGKCYTDSMTVQGRDWKRVSDTDSVNKTFIFNPSKKAFSMRTWDASVMTVRGTCAGCGKRQEYRIPPSLISSTSCCNLLTDKSDSGTNT